jgi:hypothetical protein
LQATRKLKALAESLEVGLAAMLGKSQCGNSDRFR